MDDKTLIAGYRPLQGREVDAKSRALVEAYHRLLTDKLIARDDFLASLPPTLVTHRFGSGGFDAMTTTNMALFNAAHPLRDPYRAATLNELALQLTYQGRFIHAWKEPECVLLVGLNWNDSAYTMLNVNRLPCYVVDAVPAEPPIARIEAWAKTFEMRLGQLIHGTIPQLAGRYSGQGLGVAALGDVGQIATFGAALRQFDGFLSKDTTYAFFDSADRIAMIYKHLREKHPHAQFSLRFYECPAYASDDPATSARRGTLLVTGLEEMLDYNFQPTWSSQIRYVQATAPQTPAETLGRITTRYFGEAFLSAEDGSGRFETVKLQAPALIRSSAPVPSYSRTLIESPVLLGHRIACVRQGGIVHSQDPQHNTYYYITREGELVHDFVQPGAFEVTPLHLSSEMKDGVRTATLTDKRVRKVKGACVPLCFAPGAHAYHSHFLLQCFPRVLLVREICPHGRLLVPHDLRTYQRRMLEMVGFGEDRLVVTEPDTVTFCDELFVPGLWPAIFSAYSERIYSELIEKVAPDVRPDPNLRIMISREARQTWRNMLNFGSVSRVLQDEFDFKVVAPEKLTIEEEIRLFRSARIVAGAEGAGLYNTCFSHKESGVLNLADQDYVMYIVASIAALRGFQVGYVFGESFQADTDLRRRGGHTDFVVEPDAVRSAARDLIELVG